MALHLTVALETRLNEQEIGSADQRPKSRRRTNSSNGDEGGSVERNKVAQVTHASPIQVAALTPVSIDLPPWSGPMTNFLTPAVTMDAGSEDVSQALIPAGLERVPVALHLTAITCSDL